MHSPRIPIALTLLGFLGNLAPASAQSCQPEWLPTLGGGAGVNGTVLALAGFDDGGGPALYVAGTFFDSGGVPVSHISKWDGSNWSSPGSGITGQGVQALIEFDDGSGPALYAGGNFSSAGGVAANNIAKWDGANWSALGSGMDARVCGMTVFDDGNGPALYAGGFFTTAGGLPASYIAKWDGANWSAVGSGVSGPAQPKVLSLCVFDDGGGPALYAAGAFTSAGGASANNLAKWDGSNWSALGSGTNGPVTSLAVFDDGGGPRLYAGGSFLSAGGGAANYIARWNGASWSALGSGTNSTVEGLAVFDDGSGPALYAGGLFTIAGGGPASGIAKWNGSFWWPVGSGVTDGVQSTSVYPLTVFDDGSGAALYAGGSFTRAGGIGALGIARWSGANWSALGNGMDNAVLALALYDDGNGPALYAGGYFTTVGGSAASYIAKWNGSSWSALGSGVNSGVRALAVFDDGSGPALYAAGGFTVAGGVPANRIARWNGSTWSAVSIGIHGPFNVSVLALSVFDAGSGPELVAGGLFTMAGGVAVNNIAKWNGSNWSALGTGIQGGSNAVVAALTVFDDGTGPALYAGGVFAGGIAKWNGSGWSALGSGVLQQYPLASQVLALAVFDPGSGPMLYAGGGFTTAGGVPASNVASWDGSSWSAAGSGTDGLVTALTAFDDGNGPSLYAGGYFATVGGVAVNCIARWDASGWSALGSGLIPYQYPFAVAAPVCALSGFDDGGGPALYAGGNFVSAPDSGDSYLAKWGNPGGCGAPGVSICEPGVGGVSACPCANPPAGGGLGCDNSSFSGGASLAASGIARITYGSVVFTTSGEKPTATSVLVQGDGLSPAGLVFGQGVRCVSGTLRRMYMKTASAGSISAPSTSDPHVHAHSAALGDTIAPGSHRYYGVYYRDPFVLGGCAASSGFNITQQLDLLWAP